MNDYEKAYAGVPKVSLRLFETCSECLLGKFTIEGEIPEGVIWEPTAKCPKCGDVRILKIQVQKVRV